MAVGIEVDAGGRAHVSGTTESTQATFPARNGPDGTYNGGETDAFVARLSRAGTKLDYAGYLGGAGSDTGIGMAVDGEGDAYASGTTNSTQATFPVKVGPDLIQNGPGGTDDAFVAKIRNVPPTVPPPAYPAASLLGLSRHRRQRDRGHRREQQDHREREGRSDPRRRGRRHRRRAVGQRLRLGQRPPLGRQGRDRLSGGSGSDRIDVRDGRRDWISCGRGRDRVIADRVDRVARDCERVRRTGRRGR